jgi:hypothetical protein
MLHDQIEAARRSFLQTWGTIIAASAGGFLAAVILGWFLLGDKLGVQPKPSVPPAEIAATQVAPPLPNSASASASAPAPAPVLAAPAEASNAEPADAADRETFKAELKAYDAEIEPMAASEDFRRWNEAAAKAVSAGKAAAMTAFHLGRYPEAVAQLRDARKRAEIEIAERDKAIRKATDDAGKALAWDMADDAKLHLAELQRLDPTNPDLPGMLGQLERLPALLEALRAADIARAEKRPAKELEQLRKALAIAPERPGLKQLADALARQIAEDNFRQAIAQAEANMDRGDLAAAQKSLAAARAIHPARNEVAQLAGRIAGLERSQRFASLTANAKTAAGRDDWAQALGLLQEAAKIEPNTVAPQIAQARGVLAAQAGVAGFLQQPNRLGTPAIAAQAEAALKSAEPFVNVSPALMRSSTQLKDTIALYGREITVRITSDNLTHIQVRGIGQVGIVREKTIRLKPGEYLIEGSRTGYKSKLVRATIAPNAEPLSLHVVCDEPV